MGIDTCGKCGSPASLVCGGCGDVAYCNKDHQKVHWKGEHKHLCKAYKIATHSQFGRYLVATRELKAGSRILNKVKPTVVGPPITSPCIGCLTCNGRLNGKPLMCSKCGRPFCSKKCAHEITDPLCQMLCQMPQAKANSQLIAPLKFLLLRKSNPDVFSKLLELESHVEEIKASDRWPELKASIVDPLGAVFKDDVELIASLIGILSTNSFELLNQNSAAPSHGLFELASLMNHDCIGNTRLVVDSSSEDGFKLSVFASVPIKKGCPILFNYVKPLDSALSRKEALQKFKFFKCECNRCQDPTEMNSFASAFLCPECEVGPVVLNGLECICHDCKSTMSTAKANQMELEISQGKQKLAKIQTRLDLFQGKQLLKEFLQKLYPTHGFILEIKQVLITCTAASINNPGPEKEPDMQRERIQWCSDVLEGLDILEPGLSLGRGATLYEKQSSMVRLANLEFEIDPSAPDQLIKTLLQAMGHLQEAKACLDLEPSSSPMAKYVAVISEDMVELSNYIDIVRDLIA